MYGVGLRVVGEAEEGGIAVAGERKRCGNGAFADTDDTHERQYSAVLLSRFRTHATSLPRNFTYAFRPAGLTSMQSFLSQPNFPRFDIPCVPLFLTSLRQMQTVQNRYAEVDV